MSRTSDWLCRNKSPVIAGILNAHALDTKMHSLNTKVPVVFRTRRKLKPRVKPRSLVTSQRVWLGRGSEIRGHNTTGCHRSARSFCERRLLPAGRDRPLPEADSKQTGRQMQRLESPGLAGTAATDGRTRGTLQYR